MGADGADGRRATAWMDPPQRAAGRGRQRWIHDGPGLLLPTRKRIDDGGRQLAPDGEENG